MERQKISRRDFLKISGATFAAAAISQLRYENVRAGEYGPTALELEQKMKATQVPILEYHYPGFKCAGVNMPENLFDAQTDYLKRGGYKTLTDKELAGFVKKGEFVPVKSIVLRIDQSAAHFEEFEKMIGILKSKKLHSIIFVASGEALTDEHWKKLAKWYKEGHISIGSHSVTHPDFRKLTDKAAFDEALSSKKTIEKKLKDFGAKVKVIGFSFPLDVVPENTNFLKRAGYGFGIGGVMESTQYNAAKEGQFILPSIYPYVTDTELDWAKQNNNVFPGAMVLVGGETFDKKVLLNGTRMTKEVVENFTGKPCDEVNIGKYMEVPGDPDFGNRISRMVGVVIHTSGQNGDIPERWTGLSTYYGLIGEKQDCHFGVGVDGIYQYRPVYKNGFGALVKGTKGLADYIAIEMGGRDFDRVLDPKCDPEVRRAIVETTDKTIGLIKELVAICPWIDVRKDIFGHCEVTATTKLDPGINYMSYFRERLYTEFGRSIRQ